MTWLSVFLGAVCLALAIASPANRGSLAGRLNVNLSYRIQNLSWSRSVWRQFRTKLRSMQVGRKAAKLDELVEFADVLVLIERLLVAGDSVSGSIAWLATRSAEVGAKKSSLLARYEAIALRLSAGASLHTELRNWQESTRSPQLRELIGKFVASSRQGVDLVAVIRALQESVDSAIRAKQLANFANSETKMLIPLVFLVLPITVIFAVFPSLSLLNIEFTN